MNDDLKKKKPKNEDDLKKGDDLKNKDDIRNKDDLIIKITQNIKTTKTTNPTLFSNWHETQAYMTIILFVDLEIQT